MIIIGSFVLTVLVKTVAALFPGYIPTLFLFYVPKDAIADGSSSTAGIYVPDSCAVG
jgi:hypothetical protein